MKTRIAVMCLALLAASTLANATTPALIPVPQKLEQREGVFQLQRDTRLLTDEISFGTGEYLAAKLRSGTGFSWRVRTSGETRSVKGAILLTTNGADVALGAEGYTLDVTADAVVVRAPNQAGLFYGAQTLLQLLPTEVFAPNPVLNIGLTLPCVYIEDRPRLRWRGLMLDVSRHFFTKDEVKCLLDEMALHKLNMFHWHLVDNAGWRIEIKKYPKLTQIGAWRLGVGFGFEPDTTTAYGPDGRYGGFYTRGDIREVVDYAAARHIAVIPEIEMPGHSSAALSAYPQFSCSGGPYSLHMVAGVPGGVYCAGKDETFTFLQDVLTEVCQLFPCKYIHIGGDEVPKESWKKCSRCQARMTAEGLKSEYELQSWFIRRIETLINGQGKNLIGWSEIGEGGLAANAVVMDWIGSGLEAAKEGHDVVMVPMKFCYFNLYQAEDRGAEPRAMKGVVPLNKVYSFEPVPNGLPAENEKHILGSEGAVWTEYITNFKQVEYMIFPRLCALAEVTWSPKASRNWEDFLRRLQTHARRLDLLGINYRRQAVVTPEPNPFR